MSVVQGQQFSVGKPQSKRLTIIDQTVDPMKSWEIQRFYHKGDSTVSGTNQDTRKVKAKVIQQYWPFKNYSSKGNQWLWGKECVVTHKELDDYSVYSGHVDDVTKKTTGYLLELYVTERGDRP